MHPQPVRRATLLVISRDELFARALDTVFTPAGFDVIHGGMEDAIRRARWLTPDAIVLHAGLLDADAPATCARLRELPEIGHRTPLVVASTARMTPAQRRDALRAGAWHFTEAPFSPEDLMLQLDVFVETKREAERYRDAALVDPVTALYTPVGIRHRAVELAALAARAGEPLACVVFSSAATSRAREGVLEATTRALRALGRRSDAIGSLGEGRFAVVAPATPASGATRLAKRLASGVEVGLRSHLRAGFDVATTVAHPNVIARELLDHARQAAVEAMKNHGDDWIRPYRR